MKESISLQGSKKSRILQVMKYAGWYENRKVDISMAKAFYASYGIELFNNAIKFLEEFSGLFKNCYIEVDNVNRPASFCFSIYTSDTYETDIRDYMFDDVNYTEPSTAYCAIEAQAQEAFILVGDIGYYYPARVWIGESGNLYATHEYEDDVRKYDNVFNLIEDELAYHELTAVVVEKEM